MTAAGWMRKQILAHPDYKQDSIVSDKVNYDLMLLMKKVSEGTVPCPDLIGSLSSKTPKTYTALECPQTSA